MGHKLIMKFLIWQNEQDAIDSLASVNDALGCPYVSDNGYIMDSWGIVTKSESKLEWRFFSAQEEYMEDLVGEFDVVDNPPDGWFPEISD